MSKHSKLFDRQSQRAGKSPVIPYSEDTQHNLNSIAFVVQHLRRLLQFELKFRPNKTAAIEGRKKEITKWERKFARAAVHGLRSALRHLPHNHPKPTPLA